MLWLTLWKTDVNGTVKPDPTGIETKAVGILCIPEAEPVGRFSFPWARPPLFRFMIYEQKYFNSRDYFLGLGAVETKWLVFRV